MKTRSTLSAAAFLALFSGLALLTSAHADAVPDDSVRVRVALETARSGSRTASVRRPRLTRRDIRLLRSRHTPARVLAKIASRQQDHRARELRRLSPVVRATGSRLALLSSQVERRGMAIEKIEPLSGSLIVRVTAAQLPALEQIPMVGAVKPAPALVDQTAAYTSAAIGAPAFWGAHFIGGRGSADVNSVDLQILGDVAQQSNPALAGLTFVVPPGAPHDAADNSHGTPVTDIAVGQPVTVCPASLTCTADDLDPARRGAAYGVDKVLNVPNSWGTSGEPGEGFDEVAWGLGISQVGNKGTVLAGAADPAEVDNESAAPSPPQPDDSSLWQSYDNVVSNFGAVYFMSAGNYRSYGSEGVGCVIYDVICVGAFDPIGNTNPSDDRIASFSSLGPTVAGRKKPDLVAVGVSDLARSDWQATGTLWQFETGTSFSSPQAAGAALLLMGAGITDPLTVKAILIDSARQGRKTASDPMGTQTGWQPDWGWGAVDMTQALAERTNFAVNPETGRLPAIGPGDAQFYSATTTTVADRATLVWNRRVQGCPFNATDWSCSVAPYPLTNLNLAEYAATADPCATTPSLRDTSTSEIDNVEQVRSPGPGDVIYKVASGSVSGISAEPYAMASTRQTTRLVSPKPRVTIAGGDATLGPGEHAAVTITATNPSGTMTGCTPVLELASDDAAMQITAGPAPTGPLAPGGQVTRSFDIAGSTHGAHSLTATASDTAYGSVLITTATKGVNVDAAGPQASIAVPDGIQPAGPVAVSWAGADPSGVERFDVEASVDGAGWTGWLPATQQTAAAYPGEAGRGYRFRVRATDHFGNAGPWVESALVAIGLPSPGPGPGPNPEPKPPSGPPRAAFSARLSLPILSRSLSRLIVKGTTTRKATGNLMITFKVRVADTTTTIAKLATIRAGTFTARLKMPTRVRHWRTGTLKASYGGNSLVKPGSATRLVRRTSIRAGPAGQRL